MQNLGQKRPLVNVFRLISPQKGVATKPQKSYALMGMNSLFPLHDVLPPAGNCGFGNVVRLIPLVHHVKVHKIARLDLLHPSFAPHKGEAQQKYVLLRF